MIQLARWGAAGAVPAVLDVPVIMQRRWVFATLKVPQIQFIAGVSGHFSSHRDGYASSVEYGGDEGFFFAFFMPFFALLQVVWS